MFNKKIRKYIFIVLIIFIVLFLIFITFNLDQKFNSKYIYVNLEPYYGPLVKGDSWCVQYIDSNYIVSKENRSSYIDIYRSFVNPSVVCKGTNNQSEIYYLNRSKYSGCDHFGFSTKIRINVLYCGNYFTLYILAPTGPILYGPFNNTDLNLNDCKGEYQEECYFVVGTKDKSKDICNLIELNSMRNRCLNLIK